MSSLIRFLNRFAYGIFSYAPIILLWKFVPVDGSGDNEQYVEAFRVFLFIATVHVVAAIYLFNPFDRIAMATDYWLIVCGTLAWAQLWPQLSWFAGDLRGSGVWVIAVPMCLFLAYYSKHGIIGAKMNKSRNHRNYSLFIVALMVTVFFGSLLVRHSVILSVIAPTIVLTYLIHRAKLSAEV